MEETEILKHLVQRETELERKRAVGLARQRWAEVLNLESRIDECQLMRKWLVKQPDRAVAL